MRREYYSNSIAAFLKADPECVLGQLLINDEFETTDLQKNAWKMEINILQTELADLSDGEIAFEYTIPRIGHRIDAVCIIDGVIFLLEFKVGDTEYKKSTDDQVMDYALDLKYFHEASNNRYLVPINISTEASVMENHLQIMEDKICKVLHCSKGNIGSVIKSVLAKIWDVPLGIDIWLNSRYTPTPTIIEAAQAMYRNHTVDDIRRNDAANLTETTDTIDRIIDKCKEQHRKAICFITGVPGAGKTLAGLNIANARHQFKADEHAIFLSGNGPLVDVLQAALARDRAAREGITLSAAYRQTKAFIQIIHKFRDDALAAENPPVEKVAIFDEL